ncbi:hypothetical protein F183_A05570 [Bryobacterales bacterium F-183]|nr:hypothetical protein F183_A05570 [Bryobacterales bacterium F-183]
MISGTVSADPAFYYVLEASIENRDESAVGSLRRLVYQWTGWGSSPDRWAMNSYLLKPDAQGRFTQPVLPGTYRMIAIPHKPLTYGPPQFVVRTGIEIAVDQQVGPIAFPSPATAAAGR